MADAIRYTRNAAHRVFTKPNPVAPRAADVFVGRINGGANPVGMIRPHESGRRDHWTVTRSDGTEFSVLGSKADAADVARLGMTALSYGINVTHVPNA